MPTSCDPFRAEETTVATFDKDGGPEWERRGAVGRIRGRVRRSNPRRARRTDAPARVVFRW